MLKKEDTAKADTEPFTFKANSFTASISRGMVSSSSNV